MPVNKLLLFATVMTGVLGPMFWARFAQAQDAGGAGPGLGDLVLGIGVSAGMQYDDRDCKVGGGSSDFPGTSTCLLFAGGVDVSLLWRGRIGGMLGLYSSSGQAAIAQAVGGQTPPGFPDRISVPLALDVRPLGYLVSPGDRSWRGRLLGGLGLRLGPSLELVRTAGDSAAGAGLFFAAQAELPLHGAPRHGVSLRFTTNVIYAPQQELNNGMVRTSGSTDCATGCGYEPVVQTYLGLVYYP